MTAHRDPDRLVHAFLLDGAEELHDQVYDAVRADIEHRRQRAVIGPWRMPSMNKLVPIGLGIAAVVAVLVAGSQLLGSPVPGGAGAVPTATPSPTPAPLSTASPTPWAGLPGGPFGITGSDDPVAVTIDIASSGWVALPEFDAVSKNDDSLDPPETRGATLLAWAWPAGTGFNVYGDPCQWLGTIPETPATTPDEIAAALAAQALTDPTAPVDVAVGGFAGKAITLRVPMTFDIANATREERFADCDEDAFVFYGIEGQPEEAIARNAQGAGQVDELWILDVGGRIVIIDATYGPATPAALVEELRTLAESATFE